MDKVVVDSAFLNMLGGITGNVELCDPAGQALGVYIPRTPRPEYVGYECPLSAEELDAIEREGGGRPLADILHDLEPYT